MALSGLPTVTQRSSEEAASTEDNALRDAHGVAWDEQSPHARETRYHLRRAAYQQFRGRSIWSGLAAGCSDNSLISVEQQQSFLEMMQMQLRISVSLSDIPIQIAEPARFAGFHGEQGPVRWAPVHDVSPVTANASAEPSRRLIGNGKEQK